MDEELLGSIKLFAGQFIPEGYMECNGQIVVIPHNEALYSLLGNTFGGDIRSNNFALPNIPPPIVGMKYIIAVQGIYPSRY